MSVVDPPGEEPTQRLRRKHARTRQREERAWQLNAEGHSHRAIARRLAEEGLGAVSQQAVSKMIRRVEVRALARMSQQVEGRKALQSARLEVVFCEAMAGWRRSQEDAKAARRKTVAASAPEVDDDGEPIRGTGRPGRNEEVLELRGQVGDSAFLKTALQALADDRKLWGLDAPARRELSGPGGQPVQIADATPDTVARRMARLRRLTPAQQAAYFEALETMLQDDDGAPHEGNDDDQLPALAPAAPG